MAALIKEMFLGKEKRGPKLETKKNLGQILIERQVITPEQLDLALQKQRQEKGKYLGQILFEMGVPQEEINKALDSFEKRKPIGQILIDLQCITTQELEEALAKQKELRKEGSRKPLGILLVELGYISYSAYLQAVSKYFNIPTISLDRFFPSPTLQKAVGESFAENNLIVVLEDTPTTVKLALAEPTVNMLREIKKAMPAEKRVEFYLASPFEIESCLKRKTPFL